MTRHKEASADLYCGLVTPPNSPCRQGPSDIRRSLTSLGSFMIKPTAQERDNPRLNETTHSFSNLTPPASPTKEEYVFQKKGIKSHLSRDGSFTDDGFSEGDKDNVFSFLTCPNRQIDGADDGGQHHVNYSTALHSNERQPLHSSNMETLQEQLGHIHSVEKRDSESSYPDIFQASIRLSDLCSDSNSEVRETEAFSMRIAGQGKGSSKRLSPLPIRRRPIRNAPAQARHPVTKLQRSHTSSDRFVAQRSIADDVTISFKIGKPMDKLSDAERIMRSQSAGPDPFSSYVPHIVPLARARTRSPNPNMLGERRISPNSIGVLGLQRHNNISLRQVSGGAVWHVGGPGAVTDPRIGVYSGRGGLLKSGTNAPLYGNLFTSRADAASVLDAHERRIALAASLDQSRRIVELSSEPDKKTTSATHRHISAAEDTVWRNNEWIREGNIKILDAPLLRDDFYCSLLAYSQSAKCLAVGLGSQVYLWSEVRSVSSNERINSQSSAYVTSLSFSSLHGGRSILAIGRNDGQITLWNPLETDFRFVTKQRNPISCVSFSSRVAKRPSKRDPVVIVSTEELLVGDEAGCISIYAVEWPSEDEKDLYGWSGDVNLVCRLAVHNQQVCGLAWAPSGKFFATGGNDNSCCVFERSRVIRDQPNRRGETMRDVLKSFNGINIVPAGGAPDQSLSPEQAHERHRWFVNAAVKAIAFCPWQQGLIAIGGGSNDRCIHFYHVQSGACLATIDCAAQVTSLIWSTTRREIAATFGFPQPEHSYRIAVFSWPDCAQIVAIPWADEDRALYAISYPGGPNDGRTKGESGSWWSRTEEEGCIVVATSGASIKFHEVWSEARKATSPRKGTLGGSDILELLHGIEKDDADIIR